METKLNPNEPAIPQLFRQLLVAVGGAVVGYGWMTSETWTAIAGLITVAAPIVWRMVSIYLERRKQP